MHGNSDLHQTPGQRRTGGEERVEIRAAPEKNRPWSTRMLSRPISSATATIGQLQMASATRRMISVRRDVGRS